MVRIISAIYVGTAPINDAIEITQLQLEEGSTATSFEFRPFGTELALCQRYYEKSFSLNTAPAQGVNSFQSGGCSYASNALWVPFIPFKVSKRIVPNITFYRNFHISTDNVWGLFKEGGNWFASSTTVTNINTEHGFGVQMTGSLSQNVGYAIAGGWTADAEL